jgi:ribonuclease HII
LSNQIIAGLDEVGMGCFAGPLVVAATAFFDGDDPGLGEIKESKQVSRTRREILAPQIANAACWVDFGFASVEAINELGMNEAWQMACNMCLSSSPNIDVLIVDGVNGIRDYEGEQVVEAKADENYWHVAAASIIAKTVRDWEMRYMAKFYPHYSFESNAGYGTKAHRDALQKYGFVPNLHRTKFIRKIPNLEKQDPREAQKKWAMCSLR